MNQRMLFWLALGLLIGAPTQADAEYESVLYLTPPLETTCLAVEIPTPNQIPLTGLRWFHNDAQVAFPQLVLLEGQPGVPPDLDDTALLLAQVSGPSLAWGAVTLAEPVTSSTVTAYAVFYFPEGELTTGAGEGNGPGIGIREGSGPPFYVTGDAQD